MLVVIHRSCRERWMGQTLAPDRSHGACDNKFDGIGAPNVLPERLIAT